MGLMDMLRQRPDGGRGLSRQELEKIYSSFNSPEELNHAIGVARGEMPGQIHPMLARPTGEISQIDRYTDTRRMNPVAGALYAGLLSPAWEAYKGGVQAGIPELGKISRLLAMKQVPPELQQFSLSGSGKTSPASLANVTSSGKGLLQNVLNRLRRR